MIKENKVSKYILYAIGEIVLVVIGIMIALQVNNWNENRKESIIELEMLKSLKEDLDENVERSKNTILGDSILLNANIVLLTLLKNDKSVFHDSLQINFGHVNRYEAFFPQRMTYETLKSKGLEIIKNNILRNSIIQLFDESYLSNSHMLELKKDLYINSNSLFNKRLETTGIKEFKKMPNDFESLKSDKEFINYLSHFAAERYNFLNHSKSILKNTEHVKLELIAEIRRLER